MGIFVLASCLHNCEALIVPRRRASSPAGLRALSVRRVPHSAAGSPFFCCGALSPLLARLLGTFQIDATSEPNQFDGRSLEMMMRALFFLCLSLDLSACSPKK